MNNPYETLGVAIDATRKEIKRAYRKLAIKNHPDKGGDETIFQAIKEAYELLSNHADRDYYDTHGKAKSNSDDKQNRVIGKIMTHVQIWLGFPAGVNTDLIVFVRTSLKQELQNLNVERQKAEQSRDRVKMAIKKLSSDGDNFIGSFFDTKLNEIDYFFIKADVENDLISEALEMMNEYSWDDFTTLLIGNASNGGSGTINVTMSEGWL